MCGYSEATLRVAMVDAVQGLHYKVANKLIKDNIDLGRILAKREEESRSRKYETSSMSAFELYAKAERKVRKLATRVKRAHRIYGADTPEHKEAKQLHYDAIAQREAAREKHDTSKTRTRKENDARRITHQATEKERMDNRYAEIVAARALKMASGNTAFLIASPLERSGEHQTPKT